MRRVITVLAVIGSVTGGLGGQQRPPGQHEVPPNTLSAEERAEGYRLIFDGVTTTGWRGFRQETMPDGWRVVDGALTRVAGGGDIVTAVSLRGGIIEPAHRGLGQSQADPLSARQIDGYLQILHDHLDGRRCLEVAG